MVAARFNSVPVAVTLMLTAVFLTVGGSLSRGKVLAAQTTVPVLVELFTSEGCSSCPPADTILAKLDELQPVPGARVIVLSEHVTYWDHGGWHDPFSLEAMTERQRQYGTRFGLDDVYTPQAVVDGATQIVGSDAHKLVDAVTQAAAAPKAELTIQDATLSGGLLHFAVHGGGNLNATLVAVLAEDAAKSSVAKGENAGRTLQHVAVVRVMEEMKRGSEDGRALTLKLPAGNQKNGTVPSTSIRLIVFLADRKSGHVLAAAEQTVRR